MEYINRIILSDALKGLRKMPDGCINTCVTSPPYWGLRNYGVKGQLGLEETPEKFIKSMVKLFREVRRVLADDGTLWLNIGDSYAHTTVNIKSFRRDKEGYGDGIVRSKRGRKKDGVNRFGGGNNPAIGHVKTKDLYGIPWMLAFALRADGWYLRQDIIWSKPNPMPESVIDRCTKSHEYIFLLSKSKKYYFDAYSIATPYAEKTFTAFGSTKTGYGDGTSLIASENWAKSCPTRKAKTWKMPDGWDTAKGGHGAFHSNGREKGEVTEVTNDRANKRSVWNVSTQAFPDAHFATFPPELIVDCIKAGSPVGGIVLDPFMGSGTTAEVAAKLNRKFTGFELNPDYIKIAERRLNNSLGMFNPLTQ